MAETANTSRSTLRRVADFFTSVSGIVTAIVAIVGGVAALVAFVGHKSSQPAGAQPPAAATAGSTARTQGPTLAAWALTMNRVCRSARRELARYGHVHNASEYQRAAPTFIDVSTRIAARSRETPAPLDRAADISRFASLWDEYAQTLQDLLDAVAAGEQSAAVGAARRADRAAAGFNELAQTLGARECTMSMT